MLLLPELLELRFHSAAGVLWSDGGLLVTLVRLLVSCAQADFLRTAQHRVVILRALARLLLILLLAVRV